MFWQKLEPIVHWCPLPIEFFHRFINTWLISCVLLQVSMLAVDPGVTAEHRGSFFEYISIRKEAKERAMFTLAKMMEHSKLGTEGMIAIQCSLFSAWVDKLRTINTETTVAVLNSIPDFCNCPDVLRQEKNINPDQTRKFKVKSSQELESKIDF